MIENADPAWRKSSRCTNGTCVEVAKDGDDYLVRDSKYPETQPLRFEAAAWRDFVAGVRAGEFE
jgi:Domain of unknown function (DUF397)